MALDPNAIGRAMRTDPQAARIFAKKLDNMWKRAVITSPHVLRAMKRLKKAKRPKVFENSEALRYNLVLNSDRWNQRIPLFLLVVGVSPASIVRLVFGCQLVHAAFAPCK